MKTDDRPIDAISVVGDRFIRDILAQEGAIIYPAYACRYDGFVNDVFSEYTNPSVLRPNSVRRARLESSLTAIFSQEANEKAHAHPLEGQERLFHSSIGARLFSGAGTYYVGWTMYDVAGADENMTVWLGAHQLGRVRSDDDDNRLHLYVLPEPYYVDSGEQLRLITDANEGQYRIENIVLLPTRPEARRQTLAVQDIAAEVVGVGAEARVRLDWRTTRPARCTVTYSGAEGEPPEVSERAPLSNHGLELPGARGEDGAWFRIAAASDSGETVETGRLSLTEHLPQASGEVQSGRVAFTVTNRVDQAVNDWPITWGFPFPQGALWDLSHCRVLGPDGAPLPAQKRVQVSWEDGSVRWALFDLQVDLTPSGAVDLALEYGPDVADAPPAKGIEISADGEGVQLDAGLLRIGISRADYAFPARIEVQEDGAYRPVTGFGGALPAIALRDADGQDYTVSGAVDDVAVEEAGPLRAVVRVDAAHRSADGGTLFRSILRLTAYHNKPFVRVQHTFENDHTGDLYSVVRSLTLGANVEPGRLESVLIGEGEAAPGAGTVSLRQPLDDAYTLRQGDATLREGEHAPNWLAASGPAGAVAVAMRDFWQNYPKGWQVGPSGIEIGICPDVSDVSYPQGGVEEVRSFFYLQGGQYKFKRGMSRTHDMLFAFGPEPEDAAQPVRPFSEPPLIRVEPDLFVRTGVLSDYAMRSDATGQYDGWVGEALAIYERDRVDTRAYGMLNYGDWYGERRSNWGDMEYDTPYGFLLEYLRGGSTRHYDLGWQAAWHLVDVDTCHYHEDPNRAGRQYLHSLGHVGGYYPDNYLPGAISQESMSWTHTWVEGLFLYALLTGEQRLWEVASRTMEILAGADLNDYDFTNCRDCGWPLRHLIGAYQATGRRLFLNGARIIVERVLERQRPTGGWERLMVPGHCFHVPPRHMGNAGFMVGILTAALKRYHEETGDRAVGDAIVAAAHYLIRDMWEDAEGAFHYTSCPGSGVSPSLNAQVLEGLAYAWRVSRDEGLRRIVLAAWDACLETALSTTPPYGKDVSMRLRSMPFILQDVISAREAGD